MNKLSDGLRLLAIALPLALATGAAQANEAEGEVASVDAGARTLTVQGIEFTTDDQTRYENGLARFEDIKVGERVEVDFDFRDGRHIATEVEREDTPRQ